VEKMVKKSITCKLSVEEVKNNRFYIDKKDIGKFFPENNKLIKLIYGMTEISGTIKSIESSEKKKKMNYFIKISQNLNFMINNKIRITKLSEDTYEIQKI